MEEQVQNQLETKPTDAVIARLDDDADPRFRFRPILPTSFRFRPTALWFGS